MRLSVKMLREAKFKEPMALLPMKQYEALLEYMEDMEDRLSVKERAGDKTIPWESVKKDIRKKVKK